MPPLAEISDNSHPKRNPREHPVKECEKLPTKSWNSGRPGLANASRLHQDQTAQGWQQSAPKLKPGNVNYAVWTEFAAMSQSNTTDKPPLPPN